MKVNGGGDGWQRLVGAYGTGNQQPADTSRPGTPPGGDRVELSANAQLLQHLHNLPPESREALVAHVRQALAAGTYVVDVNLVAAAVLRSQVLDEGGEPGGGR